MASSLSLQQLHPRLSLMTAHQFWEFEISKRIWDLELWRVVLGIQFEELVGTVYGVADIVAVGTAADAIVLVAPQLRV